jgi:hypothetical protein
VLKLTKGVMPCLLLPCSAALVACNPPPKEAAMRNPSLVPESAARESRETRTEGNPASGPRADSPAEAQGRRTLSTAFIRAGPDGHLTVELLSGRAMVLRDVAMGPGEYCGLLVLGGPAGKRYCGGYGEIAAARPGGGPAPGAPDPVELGRGPSGRE